MSEKMTLSECYATLATHLLPFPQVVVTEALARSWLMYFEDCTTEEFAAGLKKAVLNAEDGFAPAPGKVHHCVTWARVSARSAPPALPEPKWERPQASPEVVDKFKRDIRERFPKLRNLPMETPVDALVVGICGALPKVKGVA